MVRNFPGSEIEDKKIKRKAWELQREGTTTSCSDIETKSGRGGREKGIKKGFFFFPFLLNLKFEVGNLNVL